LFLHDRLSKVTSDEEIDGLIETVAPHFPGYSWPGNVRELENMAERVAATYLAANSEPGFQLSHKQQTVVLPELFAKRSESRNVANGNPESLKEHVEQTEYERIRQAVDDCNGNISAAARKLKLSRTTLWRKMRRFDAHTDSASSS